MQTLSRPGKMVAFATSEKEETEEIHEENCGIKEKNSLKPRIFLRKECVGSQPGRKEQKTEEMIESPHQLFCLVFSSSIPF